MGKHSDTSGAGSPSAGGTSGKKPQKGQTTQRTSGGATIWSQTAKLWGVFSGKSGK